MDLIKEEKSYIILREINGKISGTNQEFTAILISEDEFSANKRDKFKSLSDWSLKNSSNIFIIESNKAIVKIFPQVNIEDNSFK